MEIPDFLYAALPEYVGEPRSVSKRVLSETAYFLRSALLSWTTEDYGASIVYTSPTIVGWWSSVTASPSGLIRNIRVARYWENIPG
jgi:hypothetical protein